MEMAITEGGVYYEKESRISTRTGKKMPRRTVVITDVASDLCWYHNTGSRGERGWFSGLSAFREKFTDVAPVRKRPLEEQV